MLVTISEVGLPSPQALLRLSVEHGTSAGAGDKREAREGHDGNERRVRAGSYGKKRESKGKVTSHFVPSHYSFRPRFP